VFLQIRMNLVAMRTIRWGPPATFRDLFFADDDWFAEHLTAMQEVWLTPTWDASQGLIDMIHHTLIMYIARVGGSDEITMDTVQNFSFNDLTEGFQKDTEYLAEPKVFVIEE
jgi:hypothetical protein